MKASPTLLLYSSLAMLAGQASAATTGVDISKLSEAKVAMVDQSERGSPGKTYDAGTIINRPMNRICMMIQNYPAYPSFMPNTAKADASKQADNSALVDFTLNLPMGKVKKYRLKMTPVVTAKACQLTWKLVEWPGLKPDETIADTAGYWELSPLESDAGKTVVRYHVYTDPGHVPMGLGWIVDSMSKDSIPAMMEALRKKVQ